MVCYKPAMHRGRVWVGWGLCGLWLACALAARAAEPEWKPVTVPDDWKRAPAGKDGRLWYRACVEIPAAWQGRTLEMIVESVDDAREIYLGGQLVGRLGEFPPHYRSGLGITARFPVPAAAVRYGAKNLVAVRVVNIAGRSGFNVAAPVLIAGSEAIRLAGPWEMAAGDDPAWAHADPAAVRTPPLREVQDAAVVEQTLKKLPDEEGPLSPAQSLARMTTPPDLAVELVLSEPQIAQPLSMKWDHRGRLWVVNYVQYPEPAGLTVVSRDKFLRSVYDKLPLPPPHHFPGADRITIHEDTDGDGQFDRHKTFLEGLSLVSSIELGAGGVWVLNPPYLLFYSDADGDDLPDGDPVVHLEGFGIEDSHSIANNLRWGPDGWLYGVQGSTVTGKIRRPGDKTVVASQGQLVWRYHPQLRRYEIFAEGGGNAFGLEIDGQGRLFSGHNGGNTRGFHYVQGGYYQKSFGKHGDLSNPFTFGYFEAMRHHNVPRFTHAFLIYEGGALPPTYAGLLFGVAPLQGHVVLSALEPDGSTFRTRDVGYALQSSDTWFRPVDIQAGPDGAVYVADFYEQRIDHASHYQGRVDRTSGRIYRLRARDRQEGTGGFDLKKETTTALLDRLASPNKWFRQAARRELLIRGDPQTAALARQRLAQATGQTALEYLWAAHVAQPLTDEETIGLLERAEPELRCWAVRLACDDGIVGSALAERLADLAYREPQVQVRSQLASSARRLPAAVALPILAALARRSEDAQDPHLPLLVWWGLEAKADSDRQAVLALFREAALWDQPLVTQHLIERLMRRYASTGLRKDLVTAAQLLELAPTPEHARQLLGGLEAAYEGRSMVDLPPELAAAMAKVGGGSLLLRLRQGDPQAVAEALRTIADEQADPTRRSRWIGVVAGLHPPQALEVLLDVAVRARNEALQSAALSALSAYDDPRIPQTVLRLHRELPESVRDVAQSLLASRPHWAQALLAAVEAGQILPESLGEGTVRRLVLYDDPQMLAICRKHWPGLLQEASPQSVQQELARLTAVLLAGKGNPYQGKVLYHQTCGKCHTLFGQGGQVGPDLTAYKRDDLTGLLLNVLQPSAEIREGFENYVVRTADGRLLSGLLVDQDPQVVVLRTADGQTHALPRDTIEDLRASRTSLMPAGQLQPLSDEQIRDLFAYLRSPQPLPGSE